MNCRSLSRSFLGIGSLGLLACGSTGATRHPEVAPDSHDEHSHAEESPAVSPPSRDPDGTAAPQQGQDVSQAERVAYDKARPLFEMYCASCHTTQGAKASAKALDHFSMDGYRFGGHHAAEITATIREVLGAAGSKPTMPRNKPGAVKGEELRVILSWADAYDQAHASAATETPHKHDHGGHEH
jgi:hypothetical protein